MRSARQQKKPVWTAEKSGAVVFRNQHFGKERGLGLQIIAKGKVMPQRPGVPLPRQGLYPVEQHLRRAIVMQEAIAAPIETYVVPSGKRRRVETILGFELARVELQGN